MKKTILTFILGGIFFSTITATAAYVYTARDIGYNPSDENWNVTNADQALTSLKDDLNTVNSNVTEYKSQITEALADKGVEVNENSTMEEIVNGITNSSSDRNWTLVLSERISVYTGGASTSTYKEATGSTKTITIKKVGQDITITPSSNQSGTTYGGEFFYGKSTLTFVSFTYDD